jgi:hypothetical protein
LELDAIIGIVLLAASLALLTLLTVLSRRTIERIAARRLGSLREVIKDFNGERR